MSLLVSVVLATTLSSVLRSDQVVVSGPKVLKDILAKAETEKWHKLSLGTVIGNVGQQFVGTPYVGFTLDVDNPDEKCILNLQGLDCVTFYETSIAIARLIKRRVASTDPRAIGRLQAAVEDMRYRNGKRGDFTSRLHYTTDWMHDNIRRGRVTPIGNGIDGFLPLPAKPIFFMSRNAEKYRQLKADPSLIPAIRKTEELMAGRTLLYVPSNAIASIEPNLLTGDIVGILTPVEGLDTSHTGLCLRDKKGVLRLMHASSTQKQVVVGPRLSEYMEKNPKSAGLVICRPKL